LKKQIDDYFSRKIKFLKIPSKIQGGYFQKKIWLELTKIKFGQTKSYGEIAKKLKISPRFVGKVCAQNNHILLIPCHRVIRSDGSLGGFSAPDGIKLKQKLLNFEKL
jgi:methylated-DNA-[protein]-cysteine S-methyltransferase